MNRRTLAVTLGWLAVLLSVAGLLGRAQFGSVGDYLFLVGMFGVLLFTLWETYRLLKD
jgi:hypothetical protein